MTTPIPRVKAASANRIGALLKDKGNANSYAAVVREIGAAFSRAGGNLTDACGALGVSLRAMRTWVHDHPELDAEVRRVRAEKGVPHYFGDPARSKIAGSVKKKRKSMPAPKASKRPPRQTP